MYNFIIDENTDDDILDIMEDYMHLLDINIEEFKEKVTAEIWEGPYECGDHVWYEYSDNRLFSFEELDAYFDKYCSDEYDDFFDWWPSADWADTFNGLGEDDEDEIMESIKTGLQNWINSIK